jgi:hypothetical protein
MAVYYRSVPGIASRERRGGKSKIPTPFSASMAARGCGCGRSGHPRPLSPAAYSEERTNRVVGDSIATDVVRWPASDRLSDAILTGTLHRLLAPFDLQRFQPLGRKRVL